ncbi:MAG: TerC family protein [Desulfobulbaceae bacterium]|nr:TerC family protein [Desulfobulbaceae bacterium]
MEWIVSPEAWIALFTLTALEIILGIDNIIFIAILADRLPKNQQAKGRTIGLAMAMLTRIALLFSITLVMRLTEPLFTIFSLDFSGHSLILFGGGLFLLGKSTLEIHNSLEGEEEHEDETTIRGKASFFSIITQIMIFDIVFSLDSVITAIGLSEHLPVMILAIIIAVIFMMFLAGKIAAFVEAHPTFKVLALSFLSLIGLALIGESFSMHIPKGYIYFAMGFSATVEMLNMRLRKPKAEPIKLRKGHN